MDIVLGVSMAPTMVRMVLLEGENADGVTVEEDNFEVTTADGAANSGAVEQVITAILGTQEGAADANYRLMSTGVTWTESTDVGALRDSLAIRQIRGVMLVSPLLAAAALTQTVGQAMDYGYTALLFVEPESATLAVVETTDGSIVDLHRQHVHCARPGAEAVNELAAMVAALDRLDSRPAGMFVVGCGVDVVPIKRLLDPMVSVPLSAPEEPDMALARGAALASANAPLFASSTAALAYALDPGTGEVNPHALAPAYLDVSANAQLGDGALAYSAVADEDDDEGSRAYRTLLLGSGLAAVFLIGVVALFVALAADLGPTLAQRPRPHGNFVPTKQVPASPSAHVPVVAGPGSSAPPAAPPPSVAPPPPPQTITAPTPVVHFSPQPALTPVRRAPTRQEPVYVPPRAPEQAPPPPEAPPPPAAPAPPPPAAPPPAAPAPQLPPMVVYLHLPFVTVPIPINPPPPPPPPGP